ncbi:TPA: hypothetical protein VDU83_002659 [Pseudomonas aeruginosa]|nr:hypothetical protein [Pseudomonas aeruginosa]
MKKPRNFYPKQVLQQLDGKETGSLSDTERHALMFFLRRSRRYNIIVSVLQDNPAVCNDECELSANGSLPYAISGSSRVFVGNPIRLATFDLACMH